MKWCNWLSSRPAFVGLLVSAMVCLMAPISQVSPALATLATQITLSPTSGPVGTSVAVTGAGFAVDSTVAITYDGTTVDTTPATVSSDSSGNFSATFSVPASVVGGHTVEARDASGNWADAIYEVTPQITLSPTSGPVGTLVTVAGSGFAGGSSITIAYAQVPVVTTPATVTSDDCGNFSATFSVPTSAMGCHGVLALDAKFNSATAWYYVTQLTLSPTSGPVGTVVTVAGSGFAGGISITIAYDLAQVATTPAVVDSDDSGDFSLTFSVPTSAVGAHTVEATDAWGNSALATFTVTAPVITLSPISGPVGTVVTVAGSGFATRSSIAITYDAATVATAASDGSGTFSTIFVVPASVADGHTIRATDASGNSATAWYFVTPQIALSSTSGPVGTSVTVRGTGFAGKSSITISYDGATVATTTSGGSGNFKADFLVPASTPVNHLVLIRDASLHFAGATYTVTPQITVPTGWPVGTGVTVTGTGFASSSTIGITYDGTTVITIFSPWVPIPVIVTSDSCGSFSAIFLVPASVAGGHTVMATDASGNHATATYTVTPEIHATFPYAIIPSALAQAGRTYIAGVIGSGFAADSSITIKCNGKTVRTATSDASGSFGTDIFWVPLGKNEKGTDWYYGTIAAKDASGNSATFIYWTIVVF